MSAAVGARVRQPLLRLPIALVFVVPVLFAQIAVWGLRPAIGALPTALLSAALASLVGAGAYAAYVRIFERRPVVELGGPGAGSELAAGLAVGAGAFAATIGVLALLGVYRVAGRGELWPVLLAALMAIGAGAIEEIVFRGVLFRLVEEWGGTWFAVALSSLLFGAGHLVNPHATLLGALAIVFEGGVFLAGAYVLTRRLWLPIGIHAGWNFAQSGIFGVPTSGVPVHGLLRGELVGPEWLAGGEFGAEASIVAVAVCIALGTTLLVLAARRGRFVGRRGARGDRAAGLGAVS